jgi:hypothetical protein
MLVDAVMIDEVVVRRFGVGCSSSHTMKDG